MNVWVKNEFERLTYCVIVFLLISILRISTYWGVLCYYCANKDKCIWQRILCLRISVSLILDEWIYWDDWEIIISLWNFWRIGESGIVILWLQFNYGLQLIWSNGIKISDIFEQFK